MKLLEELLQLNEAVEKVEDKKAVAEFIKAMRSFVKNTSSAINSKDCYTAETWKTVHKEVKSLGNKIMSFAKKLGTNEGTIVNDMEFSTKELDKLSSLTTEIKNFKTPSLVKSNTKLDAQEKKHLKLMQQYIKSLTNDLYDSFEKNKEIYTNVIITELLDILELMIVIGLRNDGNIKKAQTKFLDLAGYIRKSLGSLGYNDDSKDGAAQAYIFPDDYERLSGGK